MLVLDAAAGVQALLSQPGLADPTGDRFIAPNLFWSEVTSVLHELRWRRAISDELADLAFDRLKKAPVDRRQPANLHRRAWELADAMGWAKTYDAEYVALAALLDCPLVTTDARLARAAARQVTVIEPADVPGLI
ncbi:MAG: type II toxin-antitoxin system VapC family toxin [Candidatus Dormibacteria bacterium]